MKFRAFFLLAATFSMASFSVQAESVSDALAKCRNTENSLQRLVCYDRVAKDVTSYSGAEDNISRSLPIRPAKPMAAAPRPMAAQSEKPTVEFGREHIRDKDRLDDSLSGVVTNLSETARGELVISFDNGTVWQQSNEMSLKLKVGQMVIIERGMLGAFYAKIEGVKKRMKVKRVK